MCLVLIAWRGHVKYPCVVAANRDELHSRPAAPAHWWPSRPRILAGQDLSAGGTWLGMTPTGRFAALTNYRDPEQRRPGTPSRGTLVTSFLMSSDSIERSLEHFGTAGPSYNGFSLLFSDGERLAIYESARGSGRILGPGIYGLSNHLLDTPWPKVQTAKSRLTTALADLDTTDAVLALLRDEAPAPDDQLPRTGVSLEWERLLSSAFVRAPDYGTRCSTVLRIDASRRACFDEWTWDAAGAPTGAVSLQFELEPATVPK
jgi:uncharacterized protein with NRDE domain